MLPVRDKYLKALQVCTTTDEDYHDAVVEPYIFPFSYHGDTSAIGVDGNVVVIGDATKSARNMLKRLLQEAQMFYDLGARLLPWAPLLSKMWCCRQKLNFLRNAAAG